MTPLQIKLAAAAIALILAFGTGWKIRAWKADSDIAALNAQIAKMISDAKDKQLQFQEQATSLEHVQADLTAANAATIAAKQEKQKVKTITVTKEVVRYAQNPDRPVVLLDADWVRLHNLAASGAELSTTTTPTGQPDDTTGIVTDADALQTVTSNYGTCLDSALKLEGMQAYGRQIELYAKRIAALNIGRGH